MLAVQLLLRCGFLDVPVRRGRPQLGPGEASARVLGERISESDPGGSKCCGLISLHVLLQHARGVVLQEIARFEIDTSQEACSRYPNVEPIVAYMPERFGTHHSKMMILLRHDDLAQ